MTETILLLGGNLGNREDFLEKALCLIRERAGSVLATSSLYESEPWGFKDNSNFLNQAVKIATRLSPRQLIETLLKIEEELGRIRTGKVTSRAIDIDILFYGNEEILTETLTIPHPRIKERLFTLLPLQEMMGEKLLPVLKKTAARLIDECPDKSQAYLYTAKTPH